MQQWCQTCWRWQQPCCQQPHCQQWWWIAPVPPMGWASVMDRGPWHQAAGEAHNKKGCIVPSFHLVLLIGLHRPHQGDHGNPKVWTANKGSCQSHHHTSKFCLLISPPMPLLIVLSSANLNKMWGPHSSPHFIIFIHCTRWFGHASTACFF